MAKPPAHPWLANIESLGDADPANAAAVALANGEIQYISPGSIPSQLGIKAQLYVPMPTGKSEGSEADSNSRQYGAYGASNQPSQHNKVNK